MNEKKKFVMPDSLIRPCQVVVEFLLDKLCRFLLDKLLVLSF